MPALNPVEKRLQKAADIWEDLVVADTVRLARLLGTSQDRQLFETFLKTEADEIGQLPDHFLHLDIPFERADQYVITLLAVLDAHARELIEEAHSYEGEDKPLVEAQFPKTWVAPKPVSGQDPAECWVLAVASFTQAFGKAFEAFGFYLVPESASNLHEWMRFLFTVAKHPKHPQTVRHLTWDDAAQPVLQPLVDAERIAITTVNADLDWSGALNETAAGADDGSPGGAFRRHYVAASTALGKGDMAGAQSSVDQGVVIATREEWPSLLTTMHCLLAAGFMGQKAFPQALGAYDKALASAEQATAKQDPVGPKLEVQAIAGKASIYMAQGDYVSAEREYALMAQKAEASQDQRMHLEGIRMQAYCRESLKDYETSFRLNGQAAQIAEAMKPEDRETSSFPYVGQALTRITQKVHREKAGSVKAYLDKVMPGWENKVVRRPEA